MKKKQLNIILIVGVISIWGFVGYRFVRTLFVQNDQLQLPISTPKNVVDISSLKRDTVPLYLPERDPFLGKRVKKVKNNSRPLAAKKIPVSKSKGPTIWPSIEYLGFIKSRKKAEILVLLKIDGVLFKARKNSIVKDIRIVKIEESEIIVTLDSEKRSIKKI